MRQRGRYRSLWGWTQTVARNDVDQTCVPVTDERTERIERSQTAADDEHVVAGFNRPHGSACERVFDQARQIVLASGQGRRQSKFRISCSEEQQVGVQRISALQLDLPAAFVRLGVDRLVMTVGDARSGCRPGGMLFDHGGQIAAKLLASDKNRPIRLDGIRITFQNPFITTPASNRPNRARPVDEIRPS